MAYLGWLFVGLIAGSVGDALFKLWWRAKAPAEAALDPAAPGLAALVQTHFQPLPIDRSVIVKPS